MNIDEVFKLMTIVEKATQWPEFRAIHDEAYLKLTEAAKEALEEIKKAREEAAKKLAELKARADAEAKSKAEEAKEKEEKPAGNGSNGRPHGMERRI